MKCCDIALKCYMITFALHSSCSLCFKGSTGNAVKPQSNKDCILHSPAALILTLPNFSY